MKNGELSQKNHWDEAYSIASVGNDEWSPTGYCEKLLERIIMPVIEEYKPRTIMEMGAGNSSWLPYIYRKTGITVYGVDYSEIGCERLREKLPDNLSENVICADFFDERIYDKLPKVDMIFSLGVIEHFQNPEKVLDVFKSFLTPDGIILTEVPNFTKKMSFICKLYQPSVFNIHVIHTQDSLRKTYQDAGVKVLGAGIVGEFTLELVAWRLSPRFPKLDPFVTRVASWIMRHEKHDLKNDTPDGPFVYIYGKG